MSADLSGPFKIVSTTEGDLPVGVDYSRVGTQLVRLGQPIQVWEIVRDRENFKFRIGGYEYTPVIDGKVAASVNPDQNMVWKATYREHQRAFTISPVDDESKGWTVDTENLANSEISIKELLCTVPTIYFNNQLFRFVPE